MHPKHTRKPDKSVTGSRLTPVWPSFSWPYLLWAWDCSMIATTSDIRTLEFLDQYPLIKYSPLCAMLALNTTAPSSYNGGKRATKVPSPLMRETEPDGIEIGAIFSFFADNTTNMICRWLIPLSTGNEISPSRLWIVRLQGTFCLRQLVWLGLVVIDIAPKVPDLSEQKSIAMEKARNLVSFIRTAPC